MSKLIFAVQIFASFCIYGLMGFDELHGMCFGETLCNIFVIAVIIACLEVMKRGIRLDAVRIGKKHFVRCAK